MRNCYFLKALVILLLLGIHGNKSYLFPKTTSNYKKERFGWLNIGLGYGKANLSWSHTPISAGISYTYSTGNSLFTIRNYYVNEFSFFGPFPRESIRDYGQLYGKVIGLSNSFISISGGISLVGVVRRGKYLNTKGIFDEYEKLTNYTFGIPVEGNLFFTPFCNLGIGTCIFANYNSKKLFSGLLIYFQIGKLK